MADWEFLYWIVDKRYKMSYIKTLINLASMNILDAVYLIQKYDLNMNVQHVFIQWNGMNRKGCRHGDQ